MELLPRFLSLSHSKCWKCLEEKVDMRVFLCCYFHLNQLCRFGQLSSVCSACYERIHGDSGASRAADEFDYAGCRRTAAQLQLDRGCGAHTQGERKRKQCEETFQITFLTGSESVGFGKRGCRNLQSPDLQDD